MGGPGIHVVPEFPGEIRLVVFPLLDGPVLVSRGGMGIKHFIMFAALGHRIASGIAPRIRVFLMHQVTDLLGKIFRIMGLIENGLPHHYGGVVPVAAHHLAHIIIYPVRKRPLAPELPSRRSDDDKQSQTVAGIHESRILGIMGTADNAHARLSQFHGILPLQVVGYGIAQPGEILVPVAPDQFFREQGTVQHQTFLRNFHSPYTHPHGTVVQQMGRILGIRSSVGLPDLHAQRVQIGIIRRPRPHIGNHQGNIHFTRGMRRNHKGSRLPHGIHALGVRHQCLHAHLLFLVRIVGYLHLHRCLSFPGAGIKGLRSEKDTAASHGPRFIRVRDVNGSRRNQVRITVNAAEIGKIQTLLGLAGRIGTVVGIVRLHDDDVLLARLQPLVQIHDDGKIPA